MNTQRTQRTWTDNDDKSSSKWLPITLLSILLVIASYVFFRLVSWEAAPKTFAISVAITKYDGNLFPQPAYPEWQMGSQQFRGLVPWEQIQTETPTTRDAISKQFNSMDDELAAKGVEPRDTVIVYLRGHTIAHQGKAYLLAGEFARKDIFNTNESGTETDTSDAGIARSAIPLDEILAQLQSLKSGNVILVADICDLRTAPKLGVIANNVTELIEQSVAKLSGENLWVITANASLQPAHVSFKRGQTLLQSACEFACDASKRDKGDPYLSLARFYEAILRYSYDVTDQKQTPLLFRSGTAGNLSDANATSWKAAQEVRVASTRKETPSTEDLDKLVPGAEKTAQSLEPQRGLQFVSYTQDPSSAQDSPSTGAGTEATPNGKGPSEVAAAPAAPLATTPALQFWQMHDALLTRNTPAGWSPVDFATGRWRKMELEACKLERATRFSNRSQAREDQRNLNLELEQLASAFKAGTTVANPNDSKWVAVWNQLQRELTPASGKLPWKIPDSIPESEAAFWRPVRDGYRQYLDTMSQLPGWLSHGLMSEDADRNQTLQSLADFVKALRAIDSKLPNAADASALDYPLAKSDLDLAQQSIKRLQSQLNRRADAALSKLRAAQSVSKTTLKWSDEREIQELLSDTRLSFAKRVELTVAYDALNAGHIRQPDDQGTALDKNLKMSDLLADSGTKGAQMHFAAWTSILRASLQLTETTVASSPTSDSPEALNAWGYQLIVDSQGLSPTNSPAIAWKQACLNDLELFPLDGGEASLLVSVSKDQSMNAVVPPSVLLPQTLTFELKRRNGASVERCYFKWQLLNADEFKTFSGSLLTATSASGQVLEQGIDNPLAVAGSQAQVKFQSALELSNKGEVLKIQVAIADQANTANPDWRAVDIYPRNPDRIDLYAKFAKPVANDPSILWSVEDSVTGEPVLRELTVPAVSQAKRAFELYLANLSDRDKLVVATIYAVQSNQLVGNGRVTAQAMKQTRSNLPKLEKLFVGSGPIQLPKNAGGMSRGRDTEPENGRRIVLVPAQASAAETPGSPQQSVAAFGEFGLVCVLQEVTPGAEGQPPIPLDKDPTLHWIDCLPLNPSRSGLVEIETPSKAGSFVIDVNVPRSHWTKWDMQELKVSARLTDARGNDVPGSQPRSAVLNPGEASASLSLSPREKSIDPYVVHVDIGGYPRSASFQSRLTGSVGDTPRGANQSFVWLEQDRLICISSDVKPINTETLNDLVVVPARENVDDKSDGTPVSVAKLIAPLQIDFPKSATRSTAEVSLDAVAQRFDFDRQYFPRFSLSDGNLVFSATAQDLTFQLPLQNYDMTGRKILKAQTSDSSETSSKSFKVVFDRIPPEKATVVTDSTKLYLKESLKLTIDCQDEDSEVRFVYFAFDQENFQEGQYDVNDELHMAAKKINGLWTSTLEANDLLQEKYPEGDYWIVCRSIDYAGNIQDQNSRERFKWIPQERPVNAPKKLSVAKPKPGPPPPPVETKHTVLIEVTVNGGKPPYPEKTAISGISGASENNTGGNWIVTKVPEGAYEVKATYSDAFGVAYEGTGKLTVTASSGRRISIDAKRSK